MNRLEIVDVASGSVILAFVLVLFAGFLKSAFASPSGEAYKWTIGIGIFLLLGIIAISVVFAWIRRREEKDSASVYDG